jgi:polyisoprenoid-binding protein YceI
MQGNLRASFVIIYVMTRRFLMAALGAAAALPAQEIWQIDSSHSGAQFSVRHMMVTTVRGQFGAVKGTVKWDAANPAKSSVEAVIDASTIDTGHAKRDADLKGADFFEVDKYPTIQFKSTKVEPAGSGRLKVTGDLTMRGVTRPVVFDVEGLMPPVKTPNGLKSGATGTARISRKEWGLTWNRAIEAGGVAVSDEVAITVDLELNKQ